MRRPEHGRWRHGAWEFVDCRLWIVNVNVDVDVGRLSQCQRQFPKAKSQEPKKIKSRSQKFLCLTRLCGETSGIN